MSMDTDRFDLTTDASEDASKVTGIFKGLFHGFALILGTSTTADVTIDNAEGLRIFDQNTLTANDFFLPRFETRDETGTLATYDGTRNVNDRYPVNGPLTITIANGGVTKTLSIIIYVER